MKIIRTSMCAGLAITATACASENKNAPETVDTLHATYQEFVLASHDQKNIDGLTIFAGAAEYASIINEWQVIALGFAGKPVNRRYYVARRTKGDYRNDIQVEWADGRTCPVLKENIDDLFSIEPPQPSPDPVQMVGGVPRLSPTGPATDGESGSIWILGRSGFEFEGAAPLYWLSKFDSTTTECWSASKPAA